MLGIFFLLHCLTGLLNGKIIDIAYQYKNTYELIWNDRNSGAAQDGSFWKISNHATEFCALGDVVANGWAKPSRSAILVTSPNGRGLSKPLSFTKVWTDAGSGAAMDVQIWKMNPPRGFTCIGYVATSNTQPDRDSYCCVRDDLLVQGRFQHTWDDRGSGARADFSGWTIYRHHRYLSGIEAQSFVMGNRYSLPRNMYPKVIDGSKKSIMSTDELAKDNKPLQLYESTDFKQIWNDRNSGARHDVSIWRVEAKPNFFRLGDIVMDSYSKPQIGFLLKVTDSDNHDAVRLPKDYVPAWSDSGSGATLDCTIWEVKCTHGYASLGYVATSGSRPSQGSVWCVNAKYLSYGSQQKLNLIWRDYGSGAKQDVGIYEQGASSSDQQSVRGFSTVRSHHYKSEPLFLLKSSAVNYWLEKPIEKIEIKSIRYHLEREKKFLSPNGSKQILKTQLTNYNYNREQELTRSVSYSKSVTSSFSFENSIQFGVEVEVTGGVPLIGEAATTVSMHNTMTFSSGSEETEVVTDTVEAKMTLGPREQADVIIIGDEYITDIPFTAQVKKTFFDGTKRTDLMTGLYRGISVREINVIYGEQQKI